MAWEASTAKVYVLAVLVAGGPRASTWVSSKDALPNLYFCLPAVSSHRWVRERQDRHTQMHTHTLGFLASLPTKAIIPSFGLYPHDLLTLRRPFQRPHLQIPLHWGEGVSI